MAERPSDAPVPPCPLRSPVGDQVIAGRAHDAAVGLGADAVDDAVVPEKRIGTRRGHLGALPAALGAEAAHARAAVLTVGHQPARAGERLQVVRVRGLAVEGDLLAATRGHLAVGRHEDGVVAVRGDEQTSGPGEHAGPVEIPVGGFGGAFGGRSNSLARCVDRVEGHGHDLLGLVEFVLAGLSQRPHREVLPLPRGDQCDLRNGQFGARLPALLLAELGPLPRRARRERRAGRRVADVQDIALRGPVEVADRVPARRDRVRQRLSLGEPVRLDLPALGGVEGGRSGDLAGERGPCGAAAPARSLGAGVPVRAAARQGAQQHAGGCQRKRLYGHPHSSKPQVMPEGRQLATPLRTGASPGRVARGGRSGEGGTDTGRCPPSTPWAAPGHGHGCEDRWREVYVSGTQTCHAPHKRVWPGGERDPLEGELYRPVVGLGRQTSAAQLGSQTASGSFGRVARWSMMPRSPGCGFVRGRRSESG